MGLVSSSLRLGSGLVLIPELMFSVFVVCFSINVIQVTNHEGTKRCSVLYGSEIWVILCVIVGKINSMMLCVKIMLIYTCLMY